MEHALGVPLLDRMPRGVEPTSYGRVLLSRGAAMFDELRQGLKEIEFLADPASGELWIGSTEPMTVVVSSVVERLNRRFPRIAFHADVGSTTSLYGQLRERRIDLAIMRMATVEAEPDMHAEVLFHDPLSIVAGKRHPLIRRRRIALAELVDEPWTLPPPTGFLGAIIVQAFHARGLQPPRTAVTTGSAQMWENLLATGRFLGVLPTAALRITTRNDHLRALPVALPDTARPIGLVTLGNRSLSPVAKLFIEETRSVVKEFAATPFRPISETGETLTGCTSRIEPDASGKTRRTAHC
jgi:DNA-binding transcriptional LysR family regulator